MSEVRPRVGLLVRTDGTREQVRFIPTEDPKMFLAVTIDGERITIRPEDQLKVDVIGPGQSITAEVAR